MCSFTPPRTSSGCTAATLGDARHGTLSDPQKIIMKLHLNWGDASDQEIGGVSVDSEEDTTFGNIDEVDEVSSPSTR